MSLLDLNYFLLMIVFVHMQQNTVQADCDCKCMCKDGGCSCWQGRVVNHVVCMDKCASAQCVFGRITCTSCADQWCEEVVVPTPPPVLTPSPVSVWDDIHCGERKTGQMYDVAHYYEFVLSTPTKVHLQDCNSDFDPNLFVYDMTTMEEVSNSVCSDGDDCGDCTNDQNHEQYTLDLPAGYYYVMIRACCGATSNAKGASYTLRIDCTDSELTVNPTTFSPSISPVTRSPTTVSPSRSPVTRSPTTVSPSRSPLFPGKTHPPTTYRPTKSPVTKPPTGAPVKRKDKESNIDSTSSYSILFSTATTVIMFIGTLIV
eukprot:152454_1